MKQRLKVFVDFDRNERSLLKILLEDTKDHPAIDLLKLKALKLLSKLNLKMLPNQIL
jgi:hypothetical protein